MAENAQTDQDPDAFCDNLTDRVASAVMDGTYDRAIFVCGTGFGVCILANKVPGIRAALVGDSFSAGKAAISKSTQLILIGACRIASNLAKTVVDAYLRKRLIQMGDPQPMSRRLTQSTPPTMRASLGHDA